MSKQFYNIYGYIVMSNIEMPLLNHIDCSAYDYVLNVIYVESVQNKVIKFKRENNKYFIKLNNYANV